MTYTDRSTMVRGTEPEAITALARPGPRTRMTQAEQEKVESCMSTADDHGPVLKTSSTATGSASGFGSERAPERPEAIAPGSALHTMLCDAAIATYSLPMFLSPLLHPATADATDRYDPAFQGEQSDPAKLLRRLWVTMEMISGPVYAEEEAEHAGYAVRELHRPISGELADGESYHAWSREIWSWNWAAITAGVMDVYGGMRGFPNARFRDDSYLGLIELGRRFGVLGMPATYPEFLEFWPAERARIADPTTPAMQRLADAVRPGGLSRPAAIPARPAWLWDFLTLPARHLQRVAIQVAVPEEYLGDLGLTMTSRDRAAIRAHRTFWRLVPRRLGHQVGLRFLRRNRQVGRPAWRTRYSEQKLATRRKALKKRET